jgi:hypothetical protein
MNEDERAQIIAHLREGVLSNEEIAAAVGVSPGTVSAVKAHITMGSYASQALAAPMGSQSDKPIDSPAGPAGSFIRWQAIALKQLGYAVNLLLGLGVGGVGFSAHLLLERKLGTGSAESTLLVASFALLVSVLLGLACVITRLVDFRTTRCAAHKREAGAPERELQPLRARYSRLGQWSWRLFWLQLAAFSLGAVGVVTAVTQYVLSSPAA